MLKRISCLLLCLVLMLVNLPAAYGDGERSLSISSAEELLAFAENCRLDSYSRGLSVKLEADIDLSGSGFFPIPSFSGRFDGAGHTISGLRVTGDGSVQGLFRYLESGGVVENLVVQGEILPEGSRAAIGGIAGKNCGSILNSRFEGSVSGGDCVGGIAGINSVSGIIDNCMVSGVVSGLHFVGGIAGDNSGVIRNCENRAMINTTEVENRIELDDISVEALTRSESVTAVTDLGGIAGISCGFIRSSINRGDVGYKSMSYNVGGIIGSQSGYLLACENYGSVLGRKEVGGIVGQLEPVAKIEYTTDTLQILSGQMDAMGGTVNQASASVQSAGAEMETQLGELEGQLEVARDAIEILADRENADPDSILAAENALTGTIEDMGETMTAMGTASVGALNSIAGSLNAMQSQMNAISGTVKNAADNLGGEFRDISDSDTAADTGAKIESCANFGPVSAELNSGGIAGAIAPANDLDTENNVAFSGNQSLNFEGELRAVILNCRNEAAVTAKKQYGGGIAGMQTMGLVKNCVNTGSVGSADAEYIGGISGRSHGFIRNSSANCELSASSLVGGIAGSATIVSDCRSIVKISDAREKTGEVLGIREESEGGESNPISSNFYLSVGADMGAIDGISYDGQAQPLSLESFTALSGLPESFKSVNVKFICEDESEITVSLPLGGSLTELPAVPEKAGHHGSWDGLSQSKLEGILFDMNFRAVYAGPDSVVESAEKRENGLTLMLLQGTFSSGTQLSLIPSAYAADTQLGERILESWELSLSGAGSISAVRYLVPENCESKSACIMLRGEDGNWTEAKTRLEGSYLVFETDGSFNAVCLKQTARSFLDTLMTASGISLLCIPLFVAFFVSLALKQRKK